MRYGGRSPKSYGMNTSFDVGDNPGNVEENRIAFLRQLGISPDQLAIPRQRHTATIKKITESGTYEECDALMTDIRDVFLSITVADCAPILLFDASKRVLASVHAGWRGTEKQILLKTILAMQQEFRSVPGDVYAFIGPSAGVCCYEVGEEVAEKFDSQFVVQRNGKLYVDIKKANEAQLQRAGVPGFNIETHNDCTICKKESYHSYRRDRERSGRMLAVIGLNQ